LLDEIQIYDRRASPQSAIGFQSVLNFDIGICR
jgi:hypothetical protein